MEFRLLYQGKLPASTNAKRRPKEKHEIRKTLHPQLRRLWRTQNGLREYAQLRGAALRQNNNFTLSHPQPSMEELFDDGISAIGNRWNNGAFNLVPLVTQEMALQCSLDILLLRPEEKKFIFEMGDIDGQLKTLIDAMRMPKDLTETGGIGPQEDENPFFCLLEDDKLISEVRVTADQLLLLPKEVEVRATDAFVVIHLKLNHKDGRTFDRWFG